ncbi:Gfo/Idh/MocA family protein [Luteolibacter algae]|uniref:Gfo/Idh/MocA family protein n=1 Tax=Luteolibacter algae TaxID=454151 RepID=A0ABW5D7L3_9BACT
MKVLKGVCIGAGYFSHFQYEAWQRIPEVEIVAFSNRDAERSQSIKDQYGIQRSYTDWREMLEQEQPDFVDIITPPPTHLEICRFAAGLGIDIICQKPLGTTLDIAKEIVSSTENVRFMVHENFRFQPWYREIKCQLEAGSIGRLHSIYMRSRMGDGWGDQAYIPRQPYFRDYPKLLIYETGVHFIDTFRYLAGEVTGASAWLRRLNPVIKGEDCGLMILEHENGCISQWDANRYNEPPHGVNARYTFGEMLLEGTEGSIRLGLDGRLILQRLGEEANVISYQPSAHGFAGDCVYACQRHFIDRLLDGNDFETSGNEYLKTMQVQEEVYQNAETRKKI